MGLPNEERWLPSYRYGGVRPMFEAVGARELGPLGRRRHVVRIDLAGEATV